MNEVVALLDRGVNIQCKNQVGYVQNTSVCRFIALHHNSEEVEILPGEEKVDLTVPVS